MIKGGVLRTLFRSIRAACLPGGAPVCAPCPHETDPAPPLASTPMKSTHVRAADTEERWLLFDASEHVLGRMATRIATALMGKDRPTWTPSEASNTHVVVINGTKPVLTGNKREQKEYAHHTGYPGGRRVLSVDEMIERRPHDVVTLAVRRMLPKGRLGHKMLSRLKVYSGEEHPHVAQNPTKVESL